MLLFSKSDVETRKKEKEQKQVLMLAKVDGKK
jgi:hypothetical protein